MIRRILLILALAVTTSSPHAAIIKFETELLAAQRYRTIYTVTNDAATPLQLFDIEFDTSLYDELSLTPVSGAGITAEWSEAILASAPGFPALYDVFASGTGIAPGATVTGFAIEFDWLGALNGAIGATQRFLVFDVTTFELLSSGTTDHGDGEEPPPTPVPEPGSFALMLAGLSALGVCRRMRRLAVSS